MSEDGVPGVVTGDTKVDGLYHGVSMLDGGGWVSGVPTFVGRFAVFLESGRTFEDWCLGAGAEVRVR